MKIAPDALIKCNIAWGGSIRGAHNCKDCDRKYLQAIEDFSLNQDIKVFYCENKKKANTLKKKECPCIILLDILWDDFGYKTYFEISYVNADGEEFDLEYTRVIFRSQKNMSDDLTEMMKYSGEYYIKLQIEGRN